MQKPVLIIMAAGMGSRYGSLKQVDPIDEYGHIIMDYSLFDAKRAGFDEAVIVIKKANEQAFHEAIGSRLSNFMNISYAYQELTDIPAPYTVPEGRVKPWGTGHAVLAAREIVGERAFAAINADDYYGPEAFRKIYRTLSEEDSYAMVGYLLKNTLTDNGSVARGICSVDEDGNLSSIRERTEIIRTERGAAFRDDDGKTWVSVDPDTIVSMNFWGFPGTFMKELESHFSAFLERTISENPLKGEYFLPFVVNDLMEEGRANVRVLTTEDVWHGVTYAQDKAEVVAAMKKLRESGVYPERLWE